MMNRRTFLGGLMGTLAAPLAAEGQQPGKLYRVGILTNKASDPAEARLWQAFQLGQASGSGVGSRAETF
jgi:hypothetical protein